MDKSPLTKRNILFMSLLISFTFALCLSVSSMFVEKNHQTMGDFQNTSSIAQTVE